MNPVLDGSFCQLVEYTCGKLNKCHVLSKAYFFERRTSKRRQNAKQKRDGIALGGCR
jgi:hypothetical protein